MKVQELINILNKLNPEVEVKVYMEDEDEDFPIEQVEFDPETSEYASIVVVR